jgi:hypothetical protein
MAFVEDVEAAEDDFGAPHPDTARPTSAIGMSHQRALVTEPLNHWAPRSGHPDLHFRDLSHPGLDAAARCSHNGLCRSERRIWDRALADEVPIPADPDLNEPVCQRLGRESPGAIAAAPSGLGASAWLHLAYPRSEMPG